MHYNKTLLLLLPIGLMTGCLDTASIKTTFENAKGTIFKQKPIDITSLQSVELDELELTESIVKHKVILAGVEDAHGNSNLDGLGPNFEQKLRSSMFKKGVDLVSVERSSVNKLIEEIKRYEMMGTSDYRPTQAANAAVRGYINAANWSASYSKKEDRPKPFDSKLFGGDGCDYTANVEGVLAFYKVNPLERFGQSIAFKGTGRKHIDTTNTTCPTLPDEQYQQLFRTAIDNAIQESGGKIASKVPTYGWVEWAGKDLQKDKTYYRLSITPDKGATPDTKVVFLVRQIVAGGMDEIEVAQGTIVPSNSSSAAFVKLSSKEDEAKIKKNTLVKLKY